MTLHNILPSSAVRCMSHFSTLLGIVFLSCTVGVLTGLLAIRKLRRPLPRACFRCADGRLHWLEHWSGSSENSCQLN